MRFVKCLSVCLILITTPLAADTPQCPFSRGFNLVGWFQKASATQVQLMRYTPQDFENLKTLGCDHIRLPIHLFNMSGDGPDYCLDPVFIDMLDQVADWAKAAELHLILDNHSFDPAIDTEPAIEAQLTAVWQQMAAHFKDRSSLIYYEILNEPHGIGDAAWNGIQQRVIDAIRAIDSTHTLIVGPAGWNSYNNLAQMPVYDDDNLIYTFHFYDPFLFTHQGATWTDPSMEDLANMPFPYDASRMPECPASLKGTWIESSLNTYQQDGTIEKIQSLLDIAISFRDSRTAPIHCGEFGAFQIGSTTEDRARWTEAVRSYLEANNIAWSMWEYQGSFGTFEPNSGLQFESDLDIPIIEALGLTVPPQTEPQVHVQTQGMILYDDYLGTQLREGSWDAGGRINYYHTDNPAGGQYCIHWTGASQYGTIAWHIVPARDFSELLNNGFRLQLMMKCDDPALKIDIRFLDTDLDGDDHPWRMRQTVDENNVELNGTWQVLDIPLDEMDDAGAWDDNTWFDPRGEFDWTQIDRLEFVAEHHAFDGIEVYIDEVKIVDANGQTTAAPALYSAPSAFSLGRAYPNPFNPVTRLTWHLPEAGQVELTLYNLKGEAVQTLAHQWQEAGRHDYSLNAAELSSGVYIAALRWRNKHQTCKLLLMK